MIEKVAIRLSSIGRDITSNSGEWGGLMSDLPEGVVATPDAQVRAIQSHTVTGPEPKLQGLVPKALSFLRHLLRIERRPWAISLAAVFGVTLTVGHVVGGVNGLIDGYERLVRTWFDEQEHIGHLSERPNEQLNSHARALAHELRSEFIRARGKLEQSGVSDFSRAEEALLSLHKVNEQIGHVWYFEGEIKRLKNSAMFTSKSCLKPLPSGGQVLDVYHQDFYRYLEIASGLPERETAGEAGAEVCYQRSEGYCTQRTAWIHHLLANDFYQIAMASIDESEELTARLEQAEKHAKEARRYRSPEGIEGFVQCIGTLPLEQKISAQLEMIRKRQ
jgi:hypothetical protein